MPMAISMQKLPYQKTNRAGDIEVEIKPPGVLPSSFQTER
jgi:hypothetical protein